MNASLNELLDAMRNAASAGILTQEQLQSLISELPYDAQIWETGYEPKGVIEFCQSLDGVPFTPRQASIFENTELLRARDFINPQKQVQELVLLYGKGSGKDWLCAKLITYLCYIVSKMKDPQGYFGLAPGTPLAILNVAPSEELARQVFFAYIRQFMSSPVMGSVRKEVMADEVRFPEKNLYLYSKHSRSSGLDGYNLLAWIMDEADAFHDAQERSNAQEVHDILRSSSNTRMKKRWLGLVISYPRQEEGFMMRLYRRAMKEDEPSFYADRAATWDVRPDVSRDDEEIASDYRADPGAAAARYECVEEETWVVDEAGLLQIKDAPNRLPKGEKPVYEVETKYGYRIKATADHLLLAGEPDAPEWTPVSDLAVGDALCVNYKEAPFGSKSLDPRLAELVGFLIANGCIGKTPRDGVAWVYNPRDKEVAERHRHFLRELGVTGHLALSGRAIQVRSRTKTAHSLFLPLLEGICKSHDKHIPSWMWQSDKPTVSAFLRGLFEADGSINKNGVLGYGSVSKRLIDETQILLSLFGIPAQIHYHRTRWSEGFQAQASEFWTLQINKRNARRFVEQIGFLSHHKVSRSHNLLKANLHPFPCDYYKDTVIAIRPCGVRPVYDLLDRPQQRFFANGLIAHNCLPQPVISAFFEYPEKIEEASKHDYPAVAEVEEVIIDREDMNGNVQSYVGGIFIEDPFTNQHIRREPGRNYFLGADAGLMGDAFAIAIVSIDSTLDAPEWVCPICGQEEALINAAPYLRLASPDVIKDMGALDKMPVCGICLAPSIEFNPVQPLLGWFRRQASATRQVDIGGRIVHIPPVREEFLCRFSPKKAMRQGERNIPIDFASMSEICRQLILALDIQKTWIDPWQGASLIQDLRAETGRAVEAAPFSNTEQFKRARLVKSLLYGGALTLQPHPTRDREWRRLQRTGTRVDHPKDITSSKDMYDAEALAIWLAVVSVRGFIDLGVM